MPTSYDVVFASFLSGIEDDFYSDMLTEEEVRVDLTSFLLTAITKFRYPRIDLTARNDTTRTFTYDLDLEEIEVLVAFMKVEWVKRRIYRLHLVQQQYTEKDFSMTSQANHLKVLLELKKETEREAKQILWDYSRSFKHEPAFSGLSGSEGDS